MIETTHLILCTYIPIIPIYNIKLLNYLLDISKNVRILCTIILVIVNIFIPFYCNVQCIIICSIFQQSQVSRLSS